MVKKRATKSSSKKCPCGKGPRYERCCARWHEGEHARDPETLMRARYSAFALGRVSFLMETTDASSPHRRGDGCAWAAELNAFCEETHFKRLSVLGRWAEGNEGKVHFRARFERQGRSAVFEEISRFLLRDGQWYYVDEVR